METFTTVVPNSSNNQNIIPFAESNRARQDIIRLASWRPLAAAYADNMRPFMDSLLDRPREVQLGESTISVVLKDRQDQASAARGDPKDGPARLPEYQAGDVRTMKRHWSGGGSIGYQSIETGEISSPEAWVREVDGPVEYGDAYFRIALRFALEQ